MTHETVLTLLAHHGIREGTRVRVEDIDGEVSEGAYRGEVTYDDVNLNGPGSSDPAGIRLAQADGGECWIVSADIRSIATPPAVAMTGMDDRQSIPDDATRNAVGIGGSQLVGKTIVACYELDGSESDEVLLLCDDGTSALVGCDPGWVNDDCTVRDPERWEVYFADTTATEAGQLARDMYADRPGGRRLPGPPTRG